MKTKIKKFVITIILILYILLMFWLGTMPDVNQRIMFATLFSAPFKHIIGIAGLVVIFNQWARLFEIKNYKIYSIVFSFFTGLLIELLQLTVPERTFSPADIIFNAIGVLIGVFILWPLFKWILKRIY